MIQIDIFNLLSFEGSSYPKKFKRFLRYQRYVGGKRTKSVADKVEMSDNEAKHDMQIHDLM